MKKRIRNKQLWVNVYEEGQAYGGPEEGGWWYSVGTPVHSERAYGKRDAIKKRDKIKKLYPYCNTGKDMYGRCSTSVIAVDSYICRIERARASSFPKTRPYYE